MTVQGNILEETQAFIARQREALLNQRETMLAQQLELQRQLDELNDMLSKFDVFEGRAAPAGRPTRGTRALRARSGSKREQLLEVIRQGNSLSRGEILEKMGLKGNKAGEMSVSNALTALTKANQVVRRDGKYAVA